MIFQTQVIFPVSLGVCNVELNAPRFRIVHRGSRNPAQNNHARYHENSILFERNPCYSRPLRRYQCVIEDCTQSLEAISHSDSSTLERFLEWLRQIFTIRDLPLDSDPEDLIFYIRLAQEAKRNYLEFLKTAFLTKAQLLPHWVCMVFKLGRYGIASRALVQLALEYPALFSPMTVEAIAAPAPTKFTLTRQEPPLMCVLRRVSGSGADEHFARLARIWNTADPEAHFRKACSLNLTVHAAMQLLNYYDENCKSRPSFRFIGVSKKSCYLCYIFLTTHPDSFVTSSCHQKLYVSWMPPPATDPKVYRRYKALSTKLGKRMEGAARQDLETRLGKLKRPIPVDSTAGVSYSGLMNPDVAETAGKGLIRLPSDFSTSLQDITNAVVETKPSAESEHSLYPIEVVNLSNNDWYSDHHRKPPITAIVFHFARADDMMRQDIVGMGDILDPIPIVHLGKG